MHKEPKDMTDAKILICEDEVMLAKEIARTLNRLGYEVTGRVSSGEEAIRAAQETKPDLILMDIQVQGKIDGINAVNRIRSQMDVPVVYLTGFAEEDVVHRAKITEPYGYLAKPVGLLELRSTVETALYKHKADMRVKESEEFHRITISSISDALMMTDDSGDFTYVCPNIHLIFGYSREEVQATGNISRLMGHDLFDPSRLETEREITNIERTIIDKDGQQRFLLVNVKRVDVKGGTVLYSCRDITDLKKSQESLREREKRFKAYFELPLVGVAMTSPEKGWLEVNDKLCDMLGYSRDELTQLTWSELTHPDDLESDVANFYKVLRGETEGYSMEKRYLLPGGKKKGAVVWADISVRRVTKPDGSVDYFVALVQDISERKQLEEVQLFLLESGRDPSKDFFQELAQFLARILQMDFVCIDRLKGDGLTAQTVAVYFDGKFEDNIEYALEDTPCGDVVGKVICCFPRDVRQLFPQDAVLQEMMAESYAGVTLWSSTGQPIGLIAAIGRKPRANLRFAEAVLKLAAVRAAGELERRAAERALRESEERYRRIFHLGPVGISVVDGKHRFVAVNAELCRITGYSAEELIGLKFDDITHPDDIESELPLAAGVFGGRLDHLDMEKRYIRKTGEPVWVRLTATLMGEGTEDGGEYGIAIIRDISDRKRVEEQLRKSEEINRLLAATTFDAICFHEGGVLVDANRQYFDMCGYEPHELIGKEVVSKTLTPESVELVRRRILEESEDRYEAVGIRKDGTKFPIEVQGRMVQLEGKKLRGTAIRDISERKKMEEDLRRSQEFLNSLLHSAPVSIGMVSDHKLQWVNDFTLNMLGYSREELLGQSVRILYESDEESERVRRIKFEELRSKGLASVVTRWKRKDGSALDVLLTSSLIASDSGSSPRVISTAIDITDLKKAEDQIKAALKEKDVLLREIHHRVKNNLAVIMSLIRLQSQYSSAKPSQEVFNDLENRVRSMAIAHEILYQTENLAYVSASAYIGNLLNHLFYSQRRVGTDVTIEKDIEEVSFGLATAIPMGYLVTELISNCFKHAFPGGRQGTVRLSLRSLGDDEFELVVADDGVGIREDIDWTHPQSMGLDLVDTFVEQLHGKMEIARGRGTEVRIRFKEVENRSGR